MKKQRIPIFTFCLLGLLLSACSFGARPQGDVSAVRARTGSPAFRFSESPAAAEPLTGFSGAAAGINADELTKTEARTVPAEIARFLELFSGTQREVVMEHAELSKGVPSKLQEILNEQGLPREILTIAFLESRFNPSIRSRRGDTVGMWQLAEGTAREYGLVVNRKKDERKDPLKATAAAAKMLSELRDKFGNWPLALAAYNSGPFRVKQAIRDSGGEKSVFTLAARGHLSRTTSDYLARFAALTLILGDPERYGFAANPSS